MSDIERKARDLLAEGYAAIGWPHLGEDVRSGAASIEPHILHAITAALTPPEGYVSRDELLSAQDRAFYDGMSKAETSIPVGYVLAPIEPTEAQWGGLARDVVMWMECYQTRSADSLLKHLNRCGTDVPKWLMEEVKGGIHSLAKGTVAAIIYKAMLEDRPEFK